MLLLVNLIMIPLFMRLFEIINSFMVVFVISFSLFEITQLHLVSDTFCEQQNLLEIASSPIFFTNLEAKSAGNEGDDPYQGLIETLFVMTLETDKFSSSTTV